MNTNPGIIGRKVGMTQIFDGDTIVPVTIVEAGPCVVLQVKRASGKDGYEAIQLGFLEQKAHRINKPESGHFKKAETTPKKYVQEMRVADASKYTVGQVLTAGEVFQAGARLDITGISKGKGFQGVMKKHNFKGFISSHGTHEFFRHGGSIGTRLTPGHVAKGKKMPGQMGNAQVTAQNLRLTKVDAEANLLYIRGAVPGATNGYVTVRATLKKW
jgi:large subunit ribosomal protein L3